MAVKDEGESKDLGERENKKDLLLVNKKVPPKNYNSNGKAIPAPLPSIETWLYIIAWSCSVMYSIYSVYKSSNANLYKLNRNNFKPGWSWIGRKQDISDYEWKLWPWYFFNHYMYWVTGHILLGQVMLWTGYKHRKYVITAYDCVAMLGCFGAKLFGFLVLACTIMHISTLFGSEVIVWIASLLIHAVPNFDTLLEMLREFAEPDSKTFNLFLPALAWTTMRSCSFCIEAVKASRPNAAQKGSGESNESGDQVPVPSSQGHYTYLDHLGYLCYLPLTCSGPCMPYYIFQEQYNAVKQPLTYARLKDILIYMLRIAFWYLVIMVSTHYVYMSALNQNYDMMQKLPLWALAGIGVLNGQFFQMKYVVTYGLPRSIAMFDQLDAPKPPKCISRIYLYSDMWKYFDRGLYQFLIRYIYAPLGGSRKGLLRQLLASFTCFSYVYYWHGAMNYLMLWTFLNFIGISIEAISNRICAIPKLQNIENNIIGLAMGRRIRAFLAVPQTVLSIVAIFYFFSDLKVGYIFFDKLIWNAGLVTLFTVYISIYFLVQTSMEATRWEAKAIKTD